MKKAIILILMVIVSVGGCRKISSAKGTPRCIDDKIREFEKNSSCSDIHVDQYTFQSGTVYLFDPGTCGADMQSPVYDNNCKHLGDLGGFTGNTKINGEDFSSATLVKTVWKK